MKSAGLKLSTIFYDNKILSFIFLSKSQLHCPHNESAVVRGDQGVPLSIDIVGVSS